jgi:hypothetical protein
VLPFVAKPVAQAGGLLLVVATSLGLVGSCTGPEVIKRVDSRNASDGINCSEGGGVAKRGGLGDVFISPRQPRVRTNRCTWLDADFSRMGRHETYDVVMRFDRYAESDSPHAAVALIRPVGRDLEGGVCGFAGNRQNIAVRVYIDSRSTPDHWKVQLRGGPSPWRRDQGEYLSTIDLGPVVEGTAIRLKFDLFFDAAHGAATIWKDDVRVYDDRDRPLGFNYNCDYRSSNADDSVNRDARDLSRAILHMQHGLYRSSTPRWILTSSGFRFYCSQRTRC